MSKVHPAAENKCQTLLLKNHDNHNHLAHERPSVLTVWKRSSMSFQGTDGFTVFDNHGRLAFRVDNYSRKNSYVKGGLVLMDGAGKPLLTLKPQVFSIQYQWNAYRGSEEGNTSSQRSTKVFSMRSKPLLFKNTDKNAEAEVFFERANGQKVTDPKPDFRIEGCFWRRNCKIRNRNGEVVANIARKKVNDRVLLGDDVFSLVVQPGFDAQLIMSFVIILDRICGKPYAPVLCS
ncbi:LURP1-related protein domain containing protein [Trema orientale]|uniref:LURP1-related protein domain containing protein n=1 Tax=Trema orientale TaxID=63057 RepID=A0A2P5CVB8_TREOI|nr:LURP1-related protein domain containing protein [Trema orientale]